MAALARLDGFQILASTFPSAEGRHEGAGARSGHADARSSRSLARSWRTRTTPTVNELRGKRGLAPVFLAAQCPCMRSDCPGWMSSCLGGRTLRVVGKRDDDADQPPVLIVEDVAG